MDKWYFGDIVDCSETNNRVLLKQLNEENYKLYNLNRIDHRNYILEETNYVFNSSQLANLDEVYDGELEQIIVDHLGMYLAFQIDTGHYKKDRVMVKK